jgi:hypothetical protein
VANVELPVLVERVVVFPNLGVGRLEIELHEAELKGSLAQFGRGVGGRTQGGSDLVPPRFLRFLLYDEKDVVGPASGITAWRVINRISLSAGVNPRLIPELIAKLIRAARLKVAQRQRVDAQFR